MQTSEVLNKAADLIERKGWWHSGIPNNDGHCASNAILHVEDLSTSDLSAHEALWTHLDGTSPTDIFAWNDAPERTAAEVIEVLRACAVIEAAKENAAVEVSA